VLVDEGHMEASWNGFALRIDDGVMELVQPDSAPVQIPLSELIGFTVLRNELLFAWRDRRRTKTARMPVPPLAIQVELFLARVEQLRPGADLRSLPQNQALLKLGGGTRGRWVWWTLSFALLAITAFALFLQRR
jgi:hypothetical protein